MVRVEIPATLIVSVYAINKKEGTALAREIFRQPNNARLLTHPDSDNILFCVVANTSGEGK